jgi:hypothetical protein
VLNLVSRQTRFLFGYLSSYVRVATMSSTLTVPHPGRRGTRQTFINAWLTASKHTDAISIQMHPASTAR